MSTKDCSKNETKILTLKKKGVAMYLNKAFVESLEFNEIKEKKPGLHPPFILSIKSEFLDNGMHSGAFEMRKNNKNIFLAILKQGNIIVLQAEKKGQIMNPIKLEGNHFSTEAIELLIEFYVKKL